MISKNYEKIKFLTFLISKFQFFSKFLSYQKLRRDLSLGNNCIVWTQFRVTILLCFQTTVWYNHSVMRQFLGNSCNYAKRSFRSKPYYKDDLEEFVLFRFLFIFFMSEAHFAGDVWDLIYFEKQLWGRCQGSRLFWKFSYLLTYHD